MRRLLPFLTLFVVLHAPDARASCAVPDVRRQLEAADAGFVGRFVSDRREGQQRWLSFRVERAVKGELSGTVEIHEPQMSSVSFGSFTPDQRVGLLLRRDGERWTSNVCQQVDPEELLDAAGPVERPPGRGTAAFLVTGQFGDASAAAVDRSGRVLAYGFGGPALGRPSACPGGDFVVLPGRVLRVRDLEVVRRLRRAGEVHCFDARARRIAQASPNGISVGGRRIWSGSYTGIAFHGRHAFLARDRRIVRVSLRDGRARTLGTVPLAPEHEPVSEIAVSDSGTRVAVLAVNRPVADGEPPSRLVLLDTRAERLRTAELEAGAEGDLVWAGESRLALLPTPDPHDGAAGLTTRYFDGLLEPAGERAGWTARGAVPWGGGVVGLLGHRIVRVGPSRASELGRLPSGGGTGVVALGAERISATRRVPR